MTLLGKSVFVDVIKDLELTYTLYYQVWTETQWQVSFWETSRRETNGRESVDWKWDGMKRNEKMRADIEVKQPQAKECLSHHRPRKGEVILP